MLVKVDKFIFLADFIILDYKVDKNTPNILGMLFLATEQTLIDIHNAVLKMRVHYYEISFDVFNSTKQPDVVDNLAPVFQIIALHEEKIVDEKVKIEELFKETIDQ